MKKEKENKKPPNKKTEAIKSMKIGMNETRSVKRTRAMIKLSEIRQVKRKTSVHATQWGLAFNESCLKALISKCPGQIFIV